MDTLRGPKLGLCEPKPILEVLVACHELRRKNETENIHQRERFRLLRPHENRVCPVDLSVRLFGNIILVSRCGPP